jgi:SAM-dependent methyltransferase
MPSTGQEGHWNKTYTGNPAFFGDGASEYAQTALNLFKGAAVRSVLELGCGQGRDTLLFAKEGFQVTALDYSEAGLLKLQESARDLGVPIASTHGPSMSESHCLSPTVPSMPATPTCCSAWSCRRWS